MTALEQRALSALYSATMRMASAGKRFRRDIAWRVDKDPDYKLTERQARYLWLLVDMYRRQIQDKELLALGAHVKLTNELPPDIYLPGDHREPIAKKQKPARPIPPAGRVPSSRYEIELARGGGKLVL